MGDRDTLQPSAQRLSERTVYRASRITGITSAPDVVTRSYITKCQFLSDSVLYNDNISYEDYAASMLYERNTSMEQQ